MSWMWLLALTSPFASADAVEDVGTSAHADLERAVQAGEWGAAEVGMASLIALESGGRPMTAEEWVWGARSAAMRGDARACRDRLVRAVRVSPSQDVFAWLQALDASYGSVALLTPDGRGATLTVSTTPFDPSARAAIAFAAEALTRTGAFEGLLPVGEYVFGGHSFVVAPAVATRIEGVSRSAPEPVVRLDGSGSLTASPVAPSASPFFAGPQAELGVSFGSLLPRGDSATSLGLADAYGGAGARVGVGLAVGGAGALGGDALVGYHGGGTNVTLSAGFAQVRATARFGGLGLALGPAWILGAVRAREDVAANLVYSAAGATGAVSLRIVQMGAMAGELALSGGVYTNAEMLLPWGASAFCIRPAPGSGR